MPADLFTVAAMARLIRITQGKRLFTLRKWSLAPDHHALIVAGKSSKSRKCPKLWDILMHKTGHDYQFSHGYHEQASKRLRLVILSTFALFCYGKYLSDIQRVRASSPPAARFQGSRPLAYVID